MGTPVLMMATLYKEAGQMTQETLLQRIQKLHNMAQGAANIGNLAEAEAFAAKVQELLLKHHLSLTDVEALELNAEKPGHDQFDLRTVYTRKRAQPKTVARWQRTLASAVAQAHLCTWFYLTNAPIVVFAGRKTDRDVAQWVYGTLVQMAVRGANNEYRKTRKTMGNQPGFKTSYREAFAFRIGERYREEEARIRRESGATGTALVHLDTARAEAKVYVHQTFNLKYTKSHTSTRDHHAGAAERGRQAANEAPIRGRGVGHGNEHKRQLGQ